MAVEKMNVVRFPEIFRFAEVEHEIEWNRSNDVFFGTILNYKSFDNFSIEDLEELTEGRDEEEDQYLACKVLTHFMKTNKVKQLLVLNN